MFQHTSNSWEIGINFNFLSHITESLINTRKSFKSFTESSMKKLIEKKNYFPLDKAKYDIWKKKFPHSRKGDVFCNSLNKHNLIDIMKLFFVHFSNIIRWGVSLTNSGNWFPSPILTIDLFEELIFLLLPCFVSPSFNVFNFYIRNCFFFVFWGKWEILIFRFFFIVRESCGKKIFF